MKKHRLLWNEVYLTKFVSGTKQSVTFFRFECKSKRVKIDHVELRTAWVTVLFSFWYPPTVFCRAAAPSSWKQVKSVAGFSLTEFPVVSYFLLHLITCNPKWFLCVCVQYICLCARLCLHLFVQVHGMCLTQKN